MHIPSSNNDTALFARASELWQADQADQAEAILRELVARHPAREEFSMLFAEILRNQGRLDAASSVIFESCNAGGYVPGASLRGAKFMQECQRHILADSVCREVVARGNRDPELLFVAGNIARELGDFERARTNYLAALAAGVDLNSSLVLGALARTQHYQGANHPDFARFIAHFGDTTCSARGRAATGFGLAKAYDDIGAWQSAAEVLHEANALVRAVQPWDIPGWNRFVEARKRAKVAKASLIRHPDFVPIFIVGLPRTGTTLTATRLASHMGARDRGELRMLRFMTDQLIRGDHLGSAAAISEAAQLYYLHARQDDAPARYYIDQDPLNFRYLDLIEAMFPQAQVIHCVRGRRDTALSLWCQDFAHPDGAFAYDFASIANYMSGHDELMHHWRQVLSLPIHTMDYEAFVADPQRVMHELSDRMDVSGQAGSSHGQVTPINTSSVWQARQPIYASSIGRWRNYLEFAPELATFRIDAGE